MSLCVCLCVSLCVYIHISNNKDSFFLYLFFTFSEDKSDLTTKINITWYLLSSKNVARTWVNKILAVRWEQGQRETFPARDRVCIPVRFALCRVIISRNRARRVQVMGTPAIALNPLCLRIRSLFARAFVVVDYFLAFMRTRMMICVCVCIVRVCVWSSILVCLSSIFSNGSAK